MIETRNVTTLVVAGLLGMTAPIAAQRVAVDAGGAFSPPVVHIAPSANIGVVPMAVARGLPTARGPDRWFPQDTADAIYRRARSELNRGRYDAAIELFRALRGAHPNSEYVAQSLYYEAFALSRSEDEDDKRGALRLLRQYLDETDTDQNGRSNRDAEELYARIVGQLARRGDAEAAAAVTEQATLWSAVPLQVTGMAYSGTTSTRYAPALAWGTSRQSDEDDVRITALNALMQMDAENAMPILRDVLANQSPDRARLRARAVFIVAQQRTEGREEILLNVARNDPDREVREQAVQWLSQVRTPAAVDALDSILQSSGDVSMQQKAVLALSQNRSTRAGEILRGYAADPDAPTELRASVIQWLGQRRDTGDFLRELYRDLDDPKLKERALMGLSQRRDPANGAFLLEVATDETEPIEMRKRALFWAGQTGRVNDRLYAMYAQVSDVEIKEQLIAVYGQRRRDGGAVDRLIDIVRTEDNTRLRNRAIFWLGQTGDPRAARALAEIINRD